MMAKCLTAIAMMLAFSSLCLGQSTLQNGVNGKASAQSSSPAGSPSATPRIAPGSVIPVQLTTTVDAKKAKTGEQVTAKVTQDLKTSTGMMLMPKDTEIVGHITEAQARNKQEKESQVGIVFDHAVINNGSVSYPLSIQAVISPQVLQNPNNGNSGNAGAAPIPSSMPSSQMPGGASRGMGGGQAAPANAPPAESVPETSGGGSQRPQITSHTQGIVGFSHMKLETPTNPAQPSVVSSEKGNVKLEDGTLMLLRVNQ
jgi:hypothetical protein